MYNKLLKKEEKLAVIGLGYVGLPIALEFAGKISVIGFDINQKRVNMMKKGIDPSKELPASAFENKDIILTTDIEVLRKAKFFIVAVPTPIDEHKVPDLVPLLSATTTVGKVLKKGDYVVFESTVYPCCTEEDCLPVLEKESGLTVLKDFKIGYSPERINPGDAIHSLTNVVKIVSGCDEKSADEIEKVYNLIIGAGVFKASSIKVAEAAKVIENTQRDLNIALMNELSIIFDKLGINTYEVIEAASTKWNFLKFFPGLVGGHCIGVDPYYLTHKAKELDYVARVILSGRFINDSMAAYIAKKTVQLLVKNGKNIIKSNVLVMGTTFKENVSDIRNSKVADLVEELITFGLNVDVVDPYAEPEDVKEEYGYNLITSPGTDYDAVIVAVNHKEYSNLNESYFKKITKENAILVDIKGLYRNKIRNLTYWSL